MRYTNLAPFIDNSLLPENPHWPQAFAGFLIPKPTCYCVGTPACGLRAAGFATVAATW